jgi:hypothetical protein
MDVYFINAYSDVFDVISYLHDVSLANRVSKCSAFVRKTADDIFTPQLVVWFFTDHGHEPFRQ